MLKLAICLVIGGAAIISALWAMVTKQRKIMFAQKELAMIKLAISAHALEWNRYPDESKSANEILISLKTPLPGGGPLLLDLWQGKGEKPKDPWGHDYCMQPRSRERPPVFYSMGPNGQDDGGHTGTDDVIAPQRIGVSDEVPKSSWLK